MSSQIGGRILDAMWTSTCGLRWTSGVMHAPVCPAREALRGTMRRVTCLDLCSHGFLGPAAAVERGVVGVAPQEEKNGAEDEDDEGGPVVDT